MSRGSEIVIGIVLLLLAAVLLLLAFMPDEQQARYLPPRLMGAMLAGALGFATLFTWGRPHTTRAAMGLLALALFGMAAYMLSDDPPNVKGIVFAVITGLVSGTYAATGRYPQSFPLSEVFGARNPKA